ncbi:hypothetical protein [Acidiphilium iwatense]|uniref:Transposase n=1 Tax=Acidiphilium iwatense TaxID=768198 RepID=A0ABS9E055_9PROT|nr:hypothetical protein [Acidiphilium iwatense]MCF3948328.1 hypothetical protein [Acidiphilium iwatense]
MVEEMREQGGSVIRDKCEALIGGFARRARRIDGDMGEITRHMTAIKWMMALTIGLELATLVMLPEHPVHQPPHQTVPGVR